MKKFWVWSDVHLEIDDTIPLPVEAEDADAIIISGDLTYASKISKTASELIKLFNLPIIFVAGNHEFYRQSSYRQAIQDIRSAAEKSITENWKQTFHFLDRDELIFGDTRILGVTLWVDMQMGAKTSQDRIWRLREAQFALNDFRQVKMDSHRLMKPSDMIELCRRDTHWLREQLQKPFDGKTVVVSHHMPHPACTPDIYRDNPHNHLFANSEKAFDDILNDEMLAPDLWICGHTHTAFDIDIGIGHTRIVCNPHGYASEFGMNGFQWDKVVGLDELDPRPPITGIK